MASILDDSGKAAGQPHDRFAANFVFFCDREAFEMILNQFGNVSVPGKLEISRKILHGIIVGLSGKFQFSVSGLNRKLKT